MATHHVPHTSALQELHCYKGAVKTHPVLKIRQLSLETEIQ